ncbi:MAG TPA: hypothetical protein VFU50_07935 [Terriglobales bacterium]|nr:hypothetical protein [Terriglobales bacterium]
MPSDYKEIIYGVVFGIAAAVLDTALDARGEGQSITGEVGGHPVMMIYRLLFVLLGFFIGWLLWRNNRRERQLRSLVEQIRHFYHTYESQAVVLHTNLQLLLTKNLKLSPEDEALLRSTYEKSCDLQASVKERPFV